MLRIFRSRVVDAIHEAFNVVFIFRVRHRRFCDAAAAHTSASTLSSARKPRMSSSVLTIAFIFGKDAVHCCGSVLLTHLFEWSCRVQRRRHQRDWRKLFVTCRRRDHGSAAPQSKTLCNLFLLDFRCFRCSLSFPAAAAQSIVPSVWRFCLLRSSKKKTMASAHKTSGFLA